MTESSPVCLFCEQGSHKVPLIALQYQNRDYWICPQHLPILIHKPSQLSGKLPGADELAVEDHSDLH
jgi:hypothetical protein